MQTSTHVLTFDGAVVRKRYVSWAHDEPSREWACLTLLAEHAPGRAPRPLARDVEDGAPVLIMERLPGSPLGGGPASKDQMHALGEALRDVYSVPLAAIEAAHLRERWLGPTTILHALKSALDDDCDLSECVEPRRVKTALDAARSHLRSAVSLPEARHGVLGIADLNPANVLWDGRVCRLVDFEDGGLSEPSFELADHAEHIANRLTGTFDPELLVDAVGLSTPERMRFEQYRRLWAIFWLLMLLPGRGGFRRNPSGTTEAQAEHVDRLLAAAKDCAGS